MSTATATVTATPFESFQILQTIAVVVWSDLRCVAVMLDQQS